jgi:hypothetical protein
MSLFSSFQWKVNQLYDAEMTGDGATAVCLIRPPGCPSTCHFCITVATVLVSNSFERGEQWLSFGYILKEFTQTLQFF